MIGPSERPSRPPHEKRKAARSREAPQPESEFGRARLAIRSLFAAKIAAAYLFAAKGEVAALVAALRAEEAASVAALHKKREGRKKTSGAFAQAARAIDRRRKERRSVRFRIHSKVKPSPRPS
jgi:hypothetical protein